jgi:hypothetical protein
VLTTVWLVVGLAVAAARLGEEALEATSDPTDVPALSGAV